MERIDGTEKTYNEESLMYKCESQVKYHIALPFLLVYNMVQKIV